MKGMENHPGNFIDIVDVGGADKIVFKCSAQLFPFCCNRTNAFGEKMYILFQFQELSPIWRKFDRKVDHVQIWLLANSFYIVVHYYHTNKIWSFNDVIRNRL